MAEEYIGTNDFLARDIPQTYEELVMAFIQECGQRYEDNVKATQGETFARGLIRGIAEKNEKHQEEIANLKDENREYKKCSLREKDATPKEITAYMKELSAEIDDLQKKNEKLTNFQEEVGGDHSVNVYECVECGKCGYGGFTACCGTDENPSTELRQVYQHVGDLMIAESKINELKEENMKLKGENQTRGLLKDVIIHNFKKENEKLKEIEKRFHIYCEILDTNPDGWEDMIGEAGYTRNENGMIVEKNA